jgi:hypothetical protein
LCGFRPADVITGDPPGDLIAAVNDHAFLLHDGKVISWGTEFPADDFQDAEETWQIRW